ncbi:MAG: trypsin-like peptidase domain-containing protein [Actinobacteria bacterium]|nr:trypsin-like peptidase domain-containing protein [Actinomycetota bacterium]MBU1943389.1 trypsin-like peptidase domain-containing protein [Actinomycetota bacterium]MBU2686746.1 trypsin-like peptidase domain-containing protein [Actinomycetota bacterium]
MNGTEGGVPPGGTPPTEPGGSRPGDYSAPGLGSQGPGAYDAEPVGPGQPPQQAPYQGAAEPPAQPPAQPPGQVPGETPPQHFTPTPGAGMIPESTLPPLPKRADMKNHRSRGGAWMMVLLALVAGIIGALIAMLVVPYAVGVNPVDLLRGKLRKAEEKSSKTSTSVLSPTEGATGVAGIARKAIPSVVNVDIRTAPQANPFFPTQAQEGTGSGVIYSADGYIITNNHVVADAQEISVTLASGKELKGQKVGADPENDIAVVKIEESGLPVMTLGDSDNLVVGQLCVAVGSPLGFEKTVTSGIVSALHRSVPVTSSTGQTTVLTDLIQTDAAINPGNSGGGLCDSQARLIGINAVIATQSGGSEGIGFAIPINTAKQVADDLIAGRPVSHPYLGILGQTVSANVAQQYNLPVDEGAYVTNIVQGGPADKAGIKTGDIVVAIDGKPVKSMDDVIAEVRTNQVGDKVVLTYYSVNEKKTAEVTLEEKPQTTP